MPIEAHFDIVIFCHTVRDEDKRRIIRAIRTSKPSVRVMVVRAAESVDASVHALDGPKALIQCVRELVTYATSGANLNFRACFCLACSHGTVPSLSLRRDRIAC